MFCRNTWQYVPRIGLTSWKSSCVSRSTLCTQFSKINTNPLRSFFRSRIAITCKKCSYYPAVFLSYHTGTEFKQKQCSYTRQISYASFSTSIDHGKINPYNGHSLWNAQNYSKRTFFLNASHQPVFSKRFKSTEPETVYEHILASEPVHMAQNVFEFGHSLSGFHWAGSIVATTLVLRFLLTFPLSVYTQNIRGKVESFQPEIIARARYVFSQRFGHRMKEENWTEKRAQRVFLRLVRLQAKEIYVRENSHPAKGSLLLLVQLPLWIMMSMALRNMSGAFSERVFTDPQYLVQDFSTGGALWFPDLMATDPYLILPVLVGLLNLINIEMNALHKGRVSRFQKGLNNFLRVVSVAMVPIAAYVPASLVLYWTVSAAYSFGQNVVLKLPTARSALNITKSKTDSTTPFRDMKEVFEQRYLGRVKVQGDEKDNVVEMFEDSPKQMNKKQP